MKKILITLLIIVLAVAMVACGDKEKVIEEVIEANLQAMNDEDIDGYMVTVYSNSSLYESTKQQITAVFEGYDIRVSINKMEVIDIDGDEARVRVIQETTNTNGQPFQDNRTTAVHTLIKDDGEWKIKSSAIENTEPL